MLNAETDIQVGPDKLVMKARSIVDMKILEESARVVVVCSTM